MDSIKFKDKNEYRAIDFDALFTTFCVVAIVAILEYSPTGQCSGPFRLWFALKALSLLIRLGIKAGFSTYLQQRWAKAVLALIKLFSVGWIIYGIFLIALEENCDTSNNLYLGLLVFIIFFIMGSLALLIAFIGALWALKKSEKEEEESELKQRLYIK
jgi:hypothetical protein